MGNNTCGTQQSYQMRFKNKYQFITLVNDHNFGDIKVYRKKQVNYDYVMVLHKYVQTSKLPGLVRQIQAIHSAFLRQNQPMALRIFNFQVDDNNISNCSLSLVKIYVEYFNYTLHDLITSHKIKRDAFTFEQLKYILNSCILTYQQFLNITQKSINLTSRNIYLSPEGAIKFCPIRSQQFFQHSNPVCGVLCNQTIYKQITTAERGQKHLLSQIKRLFSEIGQLNFQNDPEVGKIFQFFQVIKKSQKLEQVAGKLGPSKIQYLNIANKVQNSTVEQENKVTSKLTKQSTNRAISSSSSSFSFKAKHGYNQNDNTKISLMRGSFLPRQQEQRRRRFY